MQRENKLNAKSLTKIWIQLLNFGGCSPQDQGFRKKMINSFYVIFCSAIILFSISELIWTEYRNLSEFTKVFIILVGYLQVTMKFVTFRIKSKTLLEMIDIMWNKFWSVESVKSSETKIRLIQIYKFIKLVTKIYCSIILGSVLSVVCQAAVKGNRSLPINIWLPNIVILKQSLYFEICYVFEVIFMISHDIFLVGPSDALFATILGLVYCQLNILKEKLQQIGEDMEEDQHEIIKQCVEHHNLLLRFLKMLESVYSNAILLIIGSGLCLATLNLYAIVMEDDNSQKALFVFLYICILLQLYFYCQCGQIIQDEVESVGPAAYNCNWTRISNKNITSSLQLIIVRSQNKFNITAGGFMILNLENFGSIMQTSYSFLTFLENVKS